MPKVHSIEGAYSVVSLRDFVDNEALGDELVGLCDRLFGARGEHEWNLHLSSQEWRNLLFSWPQEPPDALVWRIEGKLVGIAIFGVGQLDEVFVWEMTPACAGVNADTVKEAVRHVVRNRPVLFFRRLGILEKHRRHGTSFVKMTNSVIGIAVARQAEMFIVRTKKDVYMYDMWIKSGFFPALNNIHGAPDLVIFCEELPNVKAVIDSHNRFGSK